MQFIYSIRFPFETFFLTILPGFGLFIQDPLAHFQKKGNSLKCRKEEKKEIACPFAPPFTPVHAPSYNFLYVHFQTISFRFIDNAG